MAAVTKAEPRLISTVAAPTAQAVMGGGRLSLALQNPNRLVTLIGTPGNDSLIGNWCEDDIDGGNGNDTLDGYSGNDRLAGLSAPTLSPVGKQYVAPGETLEVCSRPVFHTEFSTTFTLRRGTEIRLEPSISRRAAAAMRV